MGEIRVPVKIQGMNQDGDLSIAGAIEVEALLDTGASMTVVSRGVARAAGIAPMGHRIPVVGATGGSRVVETGLALVMIAGCVARPLVVGIDDVMPENADAEIILGHEYMQTARMVLRPYSHSATCPPARQAGAKRRSAARR
jgi:predicted aspartyl protease